MFAHWRWNLRFSHLPSHSGLIRAAPAASFSLVVISLSVDLHRGLYQIKAEVCPHSHVSETELKKWSSCLPLKPTVRLIFITYFCPSRETACRCYQKISTYIVNNYLNLAFYSRDMLGGGFFNSCLLIFQSFNFFSRIFHNFWDTAAP